MSAIRTDPCGNPERIRFGIRDVRLCEQGCHTAYGYAFQMQRLRGRGTKE